MEDVQRLLAVAVTTKHLVIIIYIHKLRRISWLHIDRVSYRIITQRDRSNN